MDIELFWFQGIDGREGFGPTLRAALVAAMGEAEASEYTLQEPDWTRENGQDESPVETTDGDYLGCVVRTF